MSKKTFIYQRPKECTDWMRYAVEHALKIDPGKGVGINPMALTVYAMDVPVLEDDPTATDMQKYLRTQAAINMFMGMDYPTSFEGGDGSHVQPYTFDNLGFEFIHFEGASTVLAIYNKDRYPIPLHAVQAASAIWYDKPIKLLEAEGTTTKEEGHG